MKPLKPNSTRIVNDWSSLPVIKPRVKLSVKQDFVSWYLQFNK